MRGSLRGIYLWVGLLVGCNLLFADAEFEQRLSGYGLNAGQIESVLRGTTSRDVAKLDTMVRWLKARKATRIPKILAHFPVLLELDIAGNLKFKIQSLRDLGFSSSQIGLMIDRYPRMLTIDVSEKMGITLRWLRRQRIQNAIEIVVKHPQLVGFDPQTKLDPVVMWLQQENFNRIPFMVRRYPPFLGLSLEENLKPTFELLQTCFGFTILEIQDSPMLLGAKLERLEELCEWAVAAEVDLSQFSLSDRRHMVQNLRLRMVLSHFLELRRETGDRRVSVVRPAQWIPQLQETETLRWLLQTRNLSANATATCIRALVAVPSTSNSAKRGSLAIPDGPR